MAKKCLICSDAAEFYIKGTSDYYCKQCAYNQFGDLAYLLKVEEEAKQLKEAVAGHGEEDVEVNITVNGEINGKK